MYHTNDGDFQCWTLGLYEGNDYLEAALGVLHLSSHQQRDAYVETLHK